MMSDSAVPAVQLDDVIYGNSSDVSSPSTPLNVTPEYDDLVTSLWRHPVPAGGWWPQAAWMLPPLGLLGALINVATLGALISERALQTTLYTYLASLCVSDVIGAVVLTSLFVARSYHADERNTTIERLGDATYAVDAALRTAQLLHLMAATLDAHWQLNGAHHQLHKRYATSGSRHVIPRRSLWPRLLLTWMTTLIMSVSPFVWFHCITDSASSDWTPTNQSNFRKLSLCVFMLTYVMPVAGVVVAYCLLLHSWLTVGCERSLAVVISKSTGLARTASSASHRSVRSLRQRQSSVRASRRSKSGGGGGPGVSRSHSTAVKASPQLDRHPSVRYSIRRRQDGSKGSVDRDSAEASLLAEVIAAEAGAACSGSSPRPPRHDGSNRDIEGELGRVASVLSMLHNAAGSRDHSGGSRAGSRRGSPKSNRSSRSDRGGTSGPDSPKLDRHPSLRYSINRGAGGGATAVVAAAGTGKSNASRSGDESDRRSGSAGGASVDPYMLLSGLQATAAQHGKDGVGGHKHRSNPDASFGSPLRDVLARVGLSPRGSREELTKELLGGSGKKRSFVRRHSSRGKRSRQPAGPDSPRLDRHPSLRYSTTRLSARSPVGPGGGSLTTCRKGVVSSMLSVSGRRSAHGGSASVSVSRHESASASTGGGGVAPVVAAGGVAAANRKESSGSNASSSIGTCHDLRPSVSAYSVARTGVVGPVESRSRPDSSSSTDTAVEGQRGRQTSIKRRSADDDLLLANRARDISRINLLRLAPSDRDVCGGSRRSREFADGGGLSASRLSPASCRRRAPTPEVAVDNWTNHRRGDQSPSLDHHHHHHQMESLIPTGATADGAGRSVTSCQGDATDVTLSGAIISVLLLLTTPATIVGLISALCGQVGSTSCRRAVSAQLIWSLQVVAFLGCVVRPVVCCAVSKILRRTVVGVFRRQNNTRNH